MSMNFSLLAFSLYLLFFYEFFLVITIYSLNEPFFHSDMRRYYFYLHRIFFVYAIMIQEIFLLSYLMFYISC